MTAAVIMLLLIFGVALALAVECAVVGVAVLVGRVRRARAARRDVDARQMQAWQAFGSAVDGGPR